MKLIIGQGDVTMTRRWAAEVVAMEQGVGAEAWAALCKSAGGAR